MWLRVKWFGQDYTINYRTGIRTLIPSFRIATEFKASGLYSKQVMFPVGESTDFIKIYRHFLEDI